MSRISGQERRRLFHKTPAQGVEHEEETQMSTSAPQDPTVGPVGTRDGSGAGDCDEPYRFGRRPSAIAPFPFTERQYARLLVFRSRVHEHLARHARANPTPIDDAF